YQAGARRPGSCLECRVCDRGWTIPGAPTPATAPTRTRRAPSRSRRAGRARRSPMPVAVASSLALPRGPLHADLFVAPPHPHTRLFNPLDPYVSILPAYRGVRAAHHFPLSGRVSHAISNLERRGEDADGARRERWRHTRERRLVGLGLRALLLWA